MRPDSERRTGDRDGELVAFLDADGAHVARVNERDGRAAAYPGMPAVVGGEGSGGLVGDHVEHFGCGLRPFWRMVDSDGADRVGGPRVGNLTGALQYLVGERAVVRRVEGGADRITVVKVGIDGGGAGGRGRGERGDQADAERDRGDGAARATRVRRQTRCRQFARQATRGQDHADGGHEHRDEHGQCEHESERQGEAADQCDGHMEAGGAGPQQRDACNHARRAESHAQDTTMMRPAAGVRIVTTGLRGPVQCLDRRDARGMAHGRPRGQHRRRNGQEQRSRQQERVGGESAERLTHRHHGRVAAARADQCADDRAGQCGDQRFGQHQRTDVRTFGPDQAQHGDIPRTLCDQRPVRAGDHHHRAQQGDDGEHRHDHGQLRGAAGHHRRRLPDHLTALDGRDAIRPGRRGEPLRDCIDIGGIIEFDEQFARRRFTEVRRIGVDRVVGAGHRLEPHIVDAADRHHTLRPVGRFQRDRATDVHAKAIGRITRDDDLVGGCRPVAGLQSEPSQGRVAGYGIHIRRAARGGTVCGDRGRIIRGRGPHLAADVRLGEHILGPRGLQRFHIGVTGIDDDIHRPQRRGRDGGHARGRRSLEHDRSSQHHCRQDHRQQDGEQSGRGMPDLRPRHPDHRAPASAFAGSAPCSSTRTTSAAAGCAISAAISPSRTTSARSV